MDRFKFTTIAHSRHDFCCPVSSSKFNEIIGALQLSKGQRVLDVGCGKAELLLRIMERYEVAGTGIDICQPFLDDAKERSIGRVPTGSLELLNASPSDLKRNDFDFALCVGSDAAFGGSFRETLVGLSNLVRPGGQLLVAAGYWQCKPDLEYLSFLGGMGESENSTHAGNVQLGLDEGLMPIYACVSSKDEWDHYEGMYLAGIERYVTQHPDDPDCDEMITRIRRWRDGYYRWGRDTLGFGIYLFMKP